MPIYKLKKCPMISLVIPRSLEEMSRKFSSDGAKAITSIIRHSFTLITISTYPLHHLETMFLFEVLLPKIIALRYEMMYAASIIIYLYLRCLLAFSSECFSSKIRIGCWPQINGWGLCMKGCISHKITSPRDTNFNSNSLLCCVVFILRSSLSRLSWLILVDRSLLHVICVFPILSWVELRSVHIFEFWYDSSLCNEVYRIEIVRWEGWSFVVAGEKFIIKSWISIILWKKTQKLYIHLILLENS